MPAAGRDDTRANSHAAATPSTVDLSPELIEVAKGTVGDRTGGVSFAVADILAPPTARYAAILCRGVLNDIIDDDRRDAVFAAFARTLRPHGALILDVREWGASAERKTREPLFRKRVSTDRGELTFTSITELDALLHASKLLHQV
jgi:SAM-dependent methyltransferase